MLATKSPKRVLFIINPKAGVGSKRSITRLIETHIDTQTITYQIAYTQFAGHASYMAKDAVEQGFDAVVAIGGDGSINEIASQLIDTPVALGIIPMGSGNGLATKLVIPRNYQTALQIINQFATQAIDVGVINNRYFFSCAGVGYAANVSARFAGKKNRGMLGYIFTISAGLHRYVPVKARVICNGGNFTTTAFDITLNNSGQFGYGFGLAPHAHLTDGVGELTVVKSFPLYLIFWVVLLFVLGKLHKSRLFSSFATQEAAIWCEQPTQAQIDGDPAMVATRFNLSIKKQALQVIVPA